MTDPLASPPPPADHGGDLARAVARHGGPPETWIDLSTGVNRRPYPLPTLAAEAWTALPDASAEAALIEAARRRYRPPSEAAIVAAPGAQALIQLLPRLDRPGVAAVVSPTYNEHARAFRAAGWRVREIAEPEDGAGCDALVLVNPNNPDGRAFAPERLLRLRGEVGRMIVDESFADPAPEVSLAPHVGGDGLITLRSFGKFYGLAGLRLGFALLCPMGARALRERLGPWAVSGPALAVGRAALEDDAWAARTIERLDVETRRLDALAAAAGWGLVGGTRLFRLYDAGDAPAAQERLAAARIWSRVFPYSRRWIRLGLPGPEPEWTRLANALTEGRR